MCFCLSLHICPWAYGRRPPQLLIFRCSPAEAKLHDALPEARAVAAACAQGEITDQNATAQQLRKELCAQSTRRLLFIGHANASDPGGAGHTLGFTAQDGGLETVRAQDIASVLGASGTGSGGALDLCFLNGCCSEELGRAARDSGVATAVCWGTKALDPAARLFSTKRANSASCAVGVASGFAFGVSAAAEPASRKQPASAGASSARVRRIGIENRIEETSNEMPVGGLHSLRRRIRAS